MVVKQNHINELRSESYNGSNDEWRSILTYSLRLRHDSEELNDQVKALEVAASLSGDAPKLKLTVTIRRRVSGISQKLGAIVLKQDDKLNLNAIDWACEAVEEADALRSELTPLEKSYKGTQETIKSLEKKLDELLAAKAAHEDALMSKFAALLNEKKVKVRNQQRLLSTAKIDPKKLKNVRETVDDAGKGTAHRGKGKRRAKNLPPESDSSDSFETMRPKLPAADKRQDHPQQTESDRQTTETETETESDTGNEETRQEGDARSTPSSRSRMDMQTSGSPSPPPPPPPRELPFARDGAESVEAGSPRQIADHDSDETASASDDEL